MDDLSSEDTDNWLKSGVHKAVRKEEVKFVKNIQTIAWSVYRIVTPNSAACILIGQSISSDQLLWLQPTQWGNAKIDSDQFPQIFFFFPLLCVSILFTTLSMNFLHLSHSSGSRQPSATNHTTPRIKFNNTDSQPCKHRQTRMTAADKSQSLAQTKSFPVS